MLEEVVTMMAASVPYELATTLVAKSSGIQVSIKATEDMVERRAPERSFSVTLTRSRLPTNRASFSYRSSTITGGNSRPRSFAHRASFCPLASTWLFEETDV